MRGRSGCTGRPGSSPTEVGGSSPSTARRRSDFSGLRPTAAQTERLRRRTSRTRAPDVSTVGSVEFDLAERTPPRLAGAARAAADIVEASIGDGYPSGASLAVVDADGTLVRTSGGWACIVGERVETTRETIYDLASLTKVIVTVMLSLALAEQGACAVD